MFYVLILIVLCIVFGVVVKSISKHPNFPPGPKWYPVIGSSGAVQKMAKIHGSQWKGFSELAKEYSTQVLGLKLGSQLTVVVYGEKNVRQVFTGPEFEGRPDSFFLRLRSFGKRSGITSNDGPLWRQYRQFTMKQLRNVGFGKTEMEHEIRNQLINLIKILSNSKCKPIQPNNTLAVAVMNVLWKYTAGETIKEENLVRLLELLTARSKAFNMTGGWLNQIPWIRFILPNLSGYNLIVKINKQISDIIEEAISRHKTKSVEGNDFIYSFMEEMGKNTDIFTEEQLKIICLDLIIAGSQTTSNVLNFAILALLRNPIIQDKIYEEINTTIGVKLPEWADTSRLIYTQAFLYEVHRYYTIVPLAGPRRVLETTCIDGYTIPENSTILISVGDVHGSTDLWEDPQKFRPERFIDNEGLLRNTEHIYAFGSGRRRCPGDSLAKSFIFIILAGIVQHFRIENINGVLPSDEQCIGIISSPKPHNAVFIQRN